ncbi:GL18992 [Drosophila persimilis]|uniref:GL18992 n=1 Tax=Drosophila persimilis TaxID=7234 RepID=B4G7A2_DROPE|nr:GL18992 [Drosophila persimilis]
MPIGKENPQKRQSLHLKEFFCTTFSTSKNNVAPGAIKEALPDQLIICRTVTSWMGSTTQSRYVNRDLERVLSVSKTEKESPHRSPVPGTSSIRREGLKRFREGRKAKAQYKAALNIQIRLQGKANKSQEKKAKLEECRLNYKQMTQMGVSNGEYANKKRQRSYDNAKLEVVHRDLIPSILKTNVGVESVEKHLLVASFYMAHADPHYLKQ